MSSTSALVGSLPLVSPRTMFLTSIVPMLNTIAIGYVNDPLWIEVKEVGVPGPQQGTAAPLLKGIGIEHRLKPADEPLPDGWYPLGESGSGSESWPRLDLSTE